LHLLLIGAGADDEVIGEGGDAGEVEDYEIGGLFRFGCAGGNQPGWRGGLGIGRFLEIGLGQNRLLKISYYAGGVAPDIAARYGRILKSEGTHARGSELRHSHFSILHYPRGFAPGYRCAIWKETEERVAKFEEPLAGARGSEWHLCFCKSLPSRDREGAVDQPIFCNSLLSRERQRASPFSLGYPSAPFSTLQHPSAPFSIHLPIRAYNEISCACSWA
jgi:hypothetical protein